MPGRRGYKRPGQSQSVVGLLLSAAHPPVVFESVDNKYIYYVYQLVRDTDMNIRVTYRIGRTWRYIKNQTTFILTILFK